MHIFTEEMQKLIDLKCQLDKTIREGGGIEACDHELVKALNKYIVDQIINRRAFTASENESLTTSNIEYKNHAEENINSKLTPEISSISSKPLNEVPSTGNFHDYYPSVGSGQQITMSIKNQGIPPFVAANKLHLSATVPFFDTRKSNTFDHTKEYKILVKKGSTILEWDPDLQLAGKKFELPKIKNLNQFWNKLKKEGFVEPLKRNKYYAYGDKQYEKYKVCKDIEFNTSNLGIFFAGVSNGRRILEDKHKNTHECLFGSKKIKKGTRRKNNKDIRKELKIDAGLISSAKAMTILLNRAFDIPPKKGGTMEEANLTIELYKQITSDPQNPAHFISDYKSERDTEKRYRMLGIMKSRLFFTCLRDYFNLNKIKENHDLYLGEDELSKTTKIYFSKLIDAYPNFITGFKSWANNIRNNAN